MQVFNLVQQLNEQLGLTVLMIIHELNLAGEFCDQLILLNKGNIQQKGTPEEVLTYENIEKVYNTVVITKTNPLSGKPSIFPVSQKDLKQNEKNNSVWLKSFFITGGQRSGQKQICSTIS